MASWRRQRDQQGAVAVLTALVTTTVLTGFASFAIDIGYQRMAARDMQAVADIVAMDMARNLNGNSTTTLLSTSWNSAVSASLARQGDTLGDALSVRSCTASDVAARTATLSVTGICAVPGVLNADGTFSGSGSARATHVKVLTRTDVDYFLPVFAEGGAAPKSAIASAETLACFMLGSYAARVNAGDSILGPLLGAIDSDLNLSLLSYQGLAGADVRLGSLATELGVGTVSELAGAQVTLGEFYLAMAHVLRSSGSSVQADLLETLSAKVDGLELSVGDLLDLTTAGPAALDASFNALDLLAGSAQVANGDYGVAVPSLGVTLPGVTNLSGNLHITERPKWKCSDEVTGTNAADAARSAQLDLNIDGTLVSLPNILGAVATTTGIDFGLTAASARGWLRDVSCGSGTSSDPEGVTVDVQTGLLDAHLNVPIRIQGNVAIGPLSVYRIDLNLLASTELNSADNTRSIDFTVPPDSYGQVKSTTNNALPMPSVSVGLDPSKTQSVRLLGLFGLPGLELGPVVGVVSPILNAVTSQIVGPIITPVVSALNILVLTRIAPALGLKLGGADLALLPRPNCSSPALRG